jgi:S-adenosylmethionine:tRNA ribosyltransferase-isomerase
VRLEDLDYELPERLIAQSPIEPRDAARLLVDRGSEPPDDEFVRDLPRILRPGDLVVVNDTRVRHARLHLRRSTGGRVEVLLLEPTPTGDWNALVRGGGRVRAGETLVDDAGTPIVEMVDRSEDTFLVRLLVDEGRLASIGEVPLPPYIREPLADASRYQTVFARDERSAAAPTAGLHLTHGLIDRLGERGIGFCRVELAVGLDTFRPIEHDDPLAHRMHSEWFRVPEATWERCAATRADGGRVVAIGTTSCRALESAASLGVLEDRTRLFIHPGHEWRVVDVLLTNFHMPRTTLLLMIDAFVGPRWRELYRTAIGREYRMLSFGDAMLLDRHAR